MGSTTMTSSDISSSNPSSTRHPSSFPPLDAHDSRQAHSNNASFASPSHPYLKPNIPDHASQAHPQYGIRPKAQSPGMAHISPPVPRINGRSRNGLPDGRHIAHHGDGSTHSRQGSAGQIVCKQTPFLPSHLMACQGPPFRQHTYRPPTLLATILTLQLADQMLACPQRYGCPRLQHRHQRPVSNRIRRSMPRRCREIPPLLGMVYLLPYPRSTPRVYRASRTHPGLPKPAFAQTPPPCTAIFSRIAYSRLEPMAGALSLLPSSRARRTCTQMHYHQQTQANVTRNSSRRTIRLQHKCGRCTPGPRPTYRTHSVWRT